MTKEEIIKAIWNELANLTLNEARKIYETTIDTIKDGQLLGYHNQKIGFQKVKTLN